MTTPYIETADYWTQVEGEEERVRTFARIPEGWEGKVDQLPHDEWVYYWMNDEEWTSLFWCSGNYGGAEIICCACDECEEGRE